MEVEKFCGHVFKFFALPIKMKIRCLKTFYKSQVLGENAYIYTVWHIIDVL